MTTDILDEIEDGIAAYEKEHEHKQVSDDCNGMYIPTNVVRRLITVRKDRSITLPSSLQQYYTQRSRETGKSVSELVVRDLGEWHEHRMFVANERERL